MLVFLNVGVSEYRETVYIMLIEMYQHDKAFWGWGVSDWLEILGESDLAFTQRYGWSRKPEYVKARRILPVLAYLLDVLPEANFLLETYVTKIVPLAQKYFGREVVDQAVGRITTILHAWGYRQKMLGHLQPV